MVEVKKMMTDTEKRIFRIISEEPMISQRDLAQRVNVSRSSASVHISNLVKKGYISGRGYVISDTENVVVLGAAMIDLYGKSTKDLLEGESNPGHVTIHPGGVSRNISENLVRLGMKVNLITSICDDPFGKVIKDSCDDLGIDISHAYFLEHDVSTIYLALLDRQGEMKLALSDTSALDKMPLDHLVRKEAVIKRGEVIVVDASLPEVLMRYLVEHHKDKKIIIDPVSIGKAQKLVGFLGKFHTLKCNRNEAEFLSGIDIVDQASLEQSADLLIAKGLKQVFITLGSEGVFYQNKLKKGLMKAVANNLVNVTGAGDAFTAGVAYCILSNCDIEYTARFASAMASFSLESMQAVNQELSHHEIHRIMESFKEEVSL